MATAERPLRKDAERNRQRILEAAAELFTERGLGVTLNDIAHHAGCGVGTVYRRFPDKELLIDALFEDRMAELVARAEEALEDPDPWAGLVGFLEYTMERQVCDRGLKELLVSTNDQGRARVEGLSSLLEPIGARLIQRAQATGALRPDVAAEDMAVISMMLGTVIDATRDIEPELFRRYLAILLRGLRAEPSPADPLPVLPLTHEQVAAAKMRYCQEPRRR